MTIFLVTFILNSRKLSVISQTLHGKWYDSRSIKYNLNNKFNKIFNVGGNGLNNYSKIQDAINNANNNDVIFIWSYSSPYYENIIIDKSIILIGENKNNTIVDSKNKEDVIYVSANRVTINNLTIQNSGNDLTNAGIHIKADEINISGNIIKNNNFGIYSYKLNTSTIKNNIIINNQNGVYLPFSYNNNISNNLISYNNDCGIYLYDSSVNNINGSRISKNIINNNKNGIYLWYSFNIEIFYNNLFDNTNGISLNHHSQLNEINNNNISNNKNNAMRLNDSTNNMIKQNNITYSDFGLKLFYSSNNYIEENLFYQNENGIDLEYSNLNYINKNDDFFNEYSINLVSSSDNRIEYNNFKRSYYGIYIKMNSNFNNIQYNNFINNKIHAYFYQSFNNKWFKNYWDDSNPDEIKIINGNIYFINEIFIFKWINFDFNPQKIPN